MGGETKIKAFSINIRLSSTLPIALPGPSPAAFGPEAAGKQAGSWPDGERHGSAGLRWAELGSDHVPGLLRQGAAG